MKLKFLLTLNNSARTSVDEVMKEGRIGTASYYSQCKTNLQNFKSSFYFEEIDEKFLKEYQTWLRNRGNSVSPVSLRLRCLRIMFNYAVKSGFISNIRSPFKDSTRVPQQGQKRFFILIN